MVAKVLSEISGSACKVRIECNYGNDACKAGAINVRNPQPNVAEQTNVKFRLGKGQRK